MNKPIYRNARKEFYSNGVFIPENEKLTLQGVYMAVGGTSTLDFITSFGYRVTLTDKVVLQKLELIT